VCHCAVSRVQWWQCILEWKSHVLRCQPGPSGSCCASVSGVFWRTYYWRQLTTVQASHVAVSVSVNSPPCMQLSTDHHINLKIASITSHTRHYFQPACLHSALHAGHSASSLTLSDTDLTCSLFRLLAVHLVPAASALHILKSGTLCLRLFDCVSHTLRCHLDWLFPKCFPIPLISSCLWFIFNFCWLLRAFWGTEMV